MQLDDLGVLRGILRLLQVNDDALDLILRFPVDVLLDPDLILEAV